MASNGKKERPITLAVDIEQEGLILDTSDDEKEYEQALKKKKHRRSDSGSLLLENRLQGIARQINFSALEFGAVLGSGSHGAVYSGKWGSRDVAIKKCGSSTELDSRWKRELVANVQAASSSVADAAVESGVPVALFYGFTMDDEGNRYLVMERLSGRTLEYVLHHELPNNEITRRCRLARQIVAAIDSLHSLGVWHRDIKLDQFMVSDDDVVKLLDLGESKVFDTESSRRTDLTKSWDLGNNFLFLSPEYYELLMEGSSPGSRRPYNARKLDVYACGVVLAMLFVQRESLTDLINCEFHTSLSKTLPRIYFLNVSKVPFIEDTPTDVFNIITDCCHPDPVQRPSFPAVLTVYDTILARMAPTTATTVDQTGSATAVQQTTGYS